MASQPAAQAPLTTPEPKWKRNTAYVKPDEQLGEGDTTLIKDFLPESIAADAFEKVKEEVQWQTMHHHGGEVPRRVAVQGEIVEDGWFPVYRHPADTSPPLRTWTPTLEAIRGHVEKTLGHPVNHALIQLYRNSEDYISEHSDKTIDVVRGSNIVNVSLGAQRVMILRQKKTTILAAQRGRPQGGPIERPAQRVPLPHNSLFVLGPETNKRWLHGIRKDGRQDSLKAPEELAFGGERISLTFRYISTFLSADGTKIYGQGATAKSREDAKTVINGDREAAQKMIDAFGFENQQSDDFDWDATYGAGFDVLHFEVVQPPQGVKPLLYYVNGSIPSWRVQMAFYEKQVNLDQERLKVMSRPKETRSAEFLALNHRGKTPVLVDGDTVINESLAILFYVEDYFAPNIPLLPPITEKSARARTLARIQETENLRRIYDVLEDSHFDGANNITPPLSAGRRAELIADIEAELHFWEKYAGEQGGETGFIAGDKFTLADCAFFPILGYMLHRGFEWDDTKWPNLHRYYDRVWGKECANKAQPDGWQCQGRANVFKATRGGAQPIYEGHGSPIHD